jgi:hypothetical protein
MPPTMEGFIPTGVRLNSRQNLVSRVGVWKIEFIPQPQWKSHGNQKLYTCQLAFMLNARHPYASIEANPRDGIRLLQAGYPAGRALFKAIADQFGMSDELNTFVGLANNVAKKAFIFF